MKTNSFFPVYGADRIDARLDKLLRKRMKLPQRHRLLHAYPLLAGMPRVATLQPELAASLSATTRFYPGTDKGLLVGVLPHTFCNPTVRGCGFCTFPHEKYRASNARAVVNAVISEIKKKSAAVPGIRERIVHGLYFGGGTANLTPSDSLRTLARTVESSFDLRQAEVTLEGVPIYFLKRDKPMNVLREELDARHFRISMGIQTFNRKMLERMGRQAFGSRKTIADVISYAHKANMTVSGDMLFNLPGQSLPAMQNDLNQAIDLGLDQICLYHLVLFRGLGTEWSRSPQLLSELPSNERACNNWIALRHKLLLAGYTHTTLTNFERKSVHHTECRFTYANFSFRPNRFDMMRFGPSAISFYSNKEFTEGWKVTNLESASEYLRRIEAGESPLDRFFVYNEHDLRVFYLMRRLAALGIEEQDYKRQFGISRVKDFSSQLAVLLNANLIKESRNTYVPTPRGMFYADTIASLFAEECKAAAPGKRNADRFPRQDKQQQVSNMDGHM
jgi:coproporphyrinogen III oxidase-like Fe-S oxidoreductase